MRLSIRDLLWATVVVAMGLGWWVSYRNRSPALSLTPLPTEQEQDED